ncbi:protein-lysine N-methyltransferase [Maudiozyma humilis]|uniref:Protein-lysine N-methyltransferase n=1 Tax=Maudiozyma humilis TaxID=51915 RepID=A0AAV5RZ63_MAUHU|nr:protein-lysine N-methyltransferase [Kazachstania humilis]
MTPTLVQQLHARVPAATLTATPHAEPFTAVRAALEQTRAVNPHYARQALKRLLDSGAYAEAPGQDDEDDDPMDWAYGEYVALLGAQADHDRADCVRYALGGTEVALWEKPRLLAAHSTTGFRTWEAALVLSEWMRAGGAPLAPGGSVLELGCGTGLCSLVLLRAGLATSAFVTDGDEALVRGPLARNFELNGGVPVASVALAAELQSGETAPQTQTGAAAPPLRFALPNGAHGTLQRLLWGEDSVPPADIVIGADITYDPSLLPALCTTLRSALVGGARACYISATVRNRDTLEAFHTALANNGLRFEQVHEATSFTTPLLRMQRPALLAPVLIYKITL